MLINNELRERAEVIALTKTAQPPDDNSILRPANMGQVLHELQVHQIELEMQNETLCQTLANLDRSNARYYDFFNIAPVGFISLNETGLILDANSICGSLLGIKLNAILEQPISRFICQKYQDQFYLYLKQLMVSDKPLTIELEMRRRDASTFWARLDSLALPQQNGSLLLRIVLSDISESKQLEEVRGSDDFQRAILNSISARIAVINSNGVIIAVNENWHSSADLFKQGTGFAVGCNYLSACLNTDAQGVYLGIRRVLDRRSTHFNLEYSSQTAGKKRWFNMSITPLGKNAQFGAVLTQTEVTQLRQDAEQLRESDEVLNSIMVTTLDGFWRLDMSGKIIDVNSVYCRQSGYTRDELLEMTISDLEAIENIEDTAEHVERIMHSGGDLFETMHRRKDGSLWPVEISTTYCEVAGGQFFGFLRDLSERHETQDELKKFGDLQLSEAQKLENAVLALRLQAANAEDTLEKEKAHIARELHDELGQLLAALRLEIGILKMDYAEQLPEIQGKTIKMLGTLDRALASMRRVVSNLRPNMLDLGLIPALEWLRDDFIKMFSIPCRLTVNHSRIPSISDMKLTAIFRIVQESLTNIAKHANASFVHINIQVNTEYLCVSVQDNGIGFDFDFNRDAAQKNRQSFGLQGMRERIMAFDGEVTIDTAPGKGCCVKINIPINGGGE
ncbi:MAG: PAS domain S-box protein [Gallionellaceae bacterium]|jgi:PAS domain S-box-containing protein